jgi:membrane fusion protein, multidrug efflux system
MQTNLICPRFTRTLLTGVLLLAMNIVSAQNAVTPIAVEFARPTQGDVNRWVTLPGSIRPLQEAMLYAKVAGYLKSINVDKGDSVKAGATLAVLETPELSADLARYRAENDAAKAEYERMQQAIKQAPDLVMPVELDRAKGKYDVAKANLERTQTLLGFNKITAPFSGVITKRFVDVGAFIPAATSGSAAQTAAVLTLMNFNTVRVQVAVPEVEAPLVNKGQPTRLSVEGLPDRKFEGKITRFSYALDDSNKTMLVEIELPNPKLELRPGMYASVQLALQHHDNVMLIPTAALVMEKANAFTYTVNGATAKKRAIKIGFNDGKMVEVQEGISANDSVILVGKKTMSDGMAIQATEAK